MVAIIVTLISYTKPWSEHKGRVHNSSRIRLSDSAVSRINN